MERLSQEKTQTDISGSSPFELHHQASLFYDPVIVQLPFLIWISKFDLYSISMVHEIKTKGDRGAYFKGL